ncbi:MAG: HD domain-containing protein, partial [Vallitaleaceae bacterium]|nr:HD domain-containing protein [Vallitaleaceae bacterium]
KYIFETGALIKQQEGMDTTVGFNNFEEKVLQENEFMDRVILYNYGGLAYKKDKNGESIKVNSDNMKYFNQAIVSMETVKVQGTYEGRKVYYQYVPYQIRGAQGANKRNVIELIYSDTILQESLKLNLVLTIVVSIFGAFIAASYGFYKARTITKPIEVITKGIKKVSQGDFEAKIHIDTNDEFSMLGTQLTNMIEQIKNLIEARYRSERDLEGKNEEIVMQKQEIEALYEETAAINEELERLLVESKKSYFETVRTLANAIEEKDSYTSYHSERVMEYSLSIAMAMGLSEHEVNDLKFGSMLHDIGKIGIPESILNKEGSLSKEDYLLIKEHPEMGNRILKNLKFLDSSRRIVFDHHERIDGKGYPRGLVGEEIHLLARIVCIADAFDAMTSIRPYRKNALSKEDAIAELLANSGKQFDQHIVEVFIRILKVNL